MARTPKIKAPWGQINAFKRDGVTLYRLRGIIDGERKSLGIYDTLKEALESAQDYAERFGDLPAGLTVGAWGKRHFDRLEVAGRSRSVAGTRAVFERYVAGSSIDHRLVRDLRPRHVREWMHGLEGQKVQHGKNKGEPLSAQTLRNALYCLSGVMKGAVNAGKAAANPCRGVSIAERPRTDEEWTFLSLDEIETLLTKVRGHGAITKKGAVHKRQNAQARRAATIYQVAIYTGMRQGELWGLQWEDVHEADEQPHLIVRYGNGRKGPTKGGRIRTVPLLPPAIEALKEWRRRGGALRRWGYVFAHETVDRKSGQVKHVSPHGKGYDAGWAETYRAASGTRPEVRFHDMRHTCASHLIMGTWGRAWRLEEVQAMLGHKSRTTTERYAHLAPDGLHRVAEETRLLWLGKGHGKDTAENDDTSKSPK